MDKIMKYFRDYLSGDLTKLSVAAQEASKTFQKLTEKILDGNKVESYIIDEFPLYYCQYEYTRRDYNLVFSEVERTYCHNLDEKYENIYEINKKLNNNID